MWESGRRAYGEGWLFRWTIAREFAPYFCVKPVDAPAGKDNTYGYGMPVSLEVSLPEVSIMQAAAGMMSLSMLGLMIAGASGAIV